jgi:hypothetical protein
MGGPLVPQAASTAVAINSHKVSNNDFFNIGLDSQ